MRTSVQAVMPDLKAIRPQRPRPLAETAETAMPVECEHIVADATSRCGPGTLHTVDGVPVRLILCFRCDHAAHERREPVTVRLGGRWTQVRP